MLSSLIPPLQDDEEDVSYDIKSLIRNIAVEKAINFIIEQNLRYKTLMLICSKVVFRRLFVKHVRERTFKCKADPQNKLTIALTEDHFPFLLVTFT